MAERKSSNPDFKNPIKSKFTTNIPEKVITAILKPDEIIYMPNDREKSAKAEFWIKWNEGPTRTKDKITASAVAQILERQTMNSSWSKPGFKEWFLNNDTFRICVEMGSVEAYEVTRQIMYSAEKESDKLKAARTIMELGKRFETAKQEVIVADAAIQKMGLSELKEFFRQNKEEVLALLEESDED